MEEMTDTHTEKSWGVVDCTLYWRNLSTPEVQPLHYVLVNAEAG